jgi:hypothetical protein
VVEAKDFNSFGQAIIKKMIAEIAGAKPAAAPGGVSTVVLSVSDQRP